ncbi:MAG: GNAT family N-acetyltransferase [Actinobacteria bacterium]|nr:GNAT family N-acetyltransferase [Actinomycetota bacterium]
MPSTIRDARASDATAIAELLGELGYPASEAAVASRLERLVIVGDRVVVAEVDREVVGLAHLHVSPTIEHERPAGRLGALVVLESHRGQGIGRQLVETLETEATARGCAVFFVTTAERRNDAHAFYESVGLERTGRRYGRTLSQ